MSAVSEEKVNAGEPEPRRRFTIAHELGHWVCQCLEGAAAAAPVYCRAEDVGVDPAAKALEREANVFAAELLMPRAMTMKAIERHGFQHAPASELEEEQFEALVTKLAKDFRVSRQAMTIRLSSLVA